MEAKNISFDTSITIEMTPPIFQSTPVKPNGVARVRADQEDIVEENGRVVTTLLYHGDCHKSSPCDNPVANPLEEGLRFLAKGELPLAVLLFEMEVQQRPESVKGWQYLGATLGENGQEKASFAALNKCLKLDPGNLPALMALAISYTNQAIRSEACQTFRRWLKAHPKYSSLVPEVATKKKKKKFWRKKVVATSVSFVSFIMSKEEHTEVTGLFMTAVQSDPDDIDPDVHVGLGLLFYLSKEYDKAAHHFRIALRLTPCNGILWNKLGSSLDKGNHKKAAVRAYRQALKFVPNFVKCRFNLGLCCLDLGAARESVEHFLVALHLQHSMNVTKSYMSEKIWVSLSDALRDMGHYDLLELVRSQNLDVLMKQFDM